MIDHDMMRSLIEERQRELRELAAGPRRLRGTRPRRLRMMAGMGLARLGLWLAGPSAPTLSRQS